MQPIVAEVNQQEDDAPGRPRVPWQFHQSIVFVDPNIHKDADSAVEQSVTMERTESEIHRVSTSTTIEEV